MPNKQPSSKKEDDLFFDYSQFAKVLRTWFVAYGIGGPVLLLSNEVVRGKIANSGMARYILGAFLLGVLSQVVITFLNKCALWFCFMAERHPARRKQWTFRPANWFAYDFWTDFGCDLFSVLMFGWATYQAFVILTA